MADPDPSRPDLLARIEQTRAQCYTLRARVAELAEAVAEVELDVARVQKGIAEQRGSLAAQAREHAERAPGVRGEGACRGGALAQGCGGLRLVGLRVTSAPRGRRGWTGKSGLEFLPEGPTGPDGEPLGGGWRHPPLRR